MTDSAPKSHSKPVADDGVRLTPKAIVAIAILIASLIFVFSNTGEIQLQFLMFAISAPAWMMLLILLLAGFLIGFFVGRNRYKRR